MTMLRTSLIAVAAFSAATHANAFRIVIGGTEISGNLGTVVAAVLDPVSVLLPTGLPSVGAVADYVVGNPDALVTLVPASLDPRYAAYTTVANAMISGRNAALARGARPIPQNIRDVLRKWIPDDSLLDSIRWTTDYSAVQNSLQAAQMTWNNQTQAIALLNVIIFRDPSKLNDLPLWIHEVQHARQYRDLGVLEFAKQWVDNSTPGGSIEQPAYEIEAMARAALQEQPPLANVSQTSAHCPPGSKSMAYCVLFVPSSSPPVQFKVAAMARASGHGNNNGRMALVVVADGKPCNLDSGVEYGVNNATQLSGDRFSCTVTVEPGRTVRVAAAAPNDKADAVFTRLSVSYASPEMLALRQRIAQYTTTTETANRQNGYYCRNGTWCSSGNCKGELRELDLPGFCLPSTALCGWPGQSAGYSLNGTTSLAGVSFKCIMDGDFPVWMRQ